MTDDDSPDAEPGAPETRDSGLASALVQGLGWTLSCLVTGVVLVLTRPVSFPVILALAAAAVAGLVTQLLRRRDSLRGRLVVLGVWAGAGALASGLTGGLSGPLAAWCLAPLGGAVALDRRKLLKTGAALSFVAFAVSLVLGLLGLSAVPAPATAVWLGALSMATVIAAFSLSISLSTGRRAARAVAAEEKARRLQAVLAEQPHLIAILDTTGKLSSAYGGAPLGLDVEALFAGGLIGAVHHPDRPAVQTALLRAATHGQAEIAFTPRAALDRQAAIALRRLEDGRLIAVIRDASLQQARESALEAARSEAEGLNAGKSRFLANMSHELRTPLNAVMGFSDVMRQKLFGPLPDRYAEYAQLIHESGGHLLDLINDVLDMSKIEAARYELHREVFDAREPVSAALRLIRLQADEAEIALRGVLPVEEVLIDADRRAIKQIVLNLLSNALKFTPRGGSITVSLEARANLFEIVVSDTGVGVAPEDLDRLGRPFEQVGDTRAKSLGTGLGLSLVRAFAQLHGGEMTIESTLGEGTAVSVRLPVALQHEDRPRLGAEIIPLDGRR